MVAMTRTRTFATQSATQGIAVDHLAVIRVYDDAGHVIETHEHTGDLKDR
jgi:hypothetical protein